MLPLYFVFFFFNDTATTEIYTLSLHDALPISHLGPLPIVFNLPAFAIVAVITVVLVIGTKESAWVNAVRSEEHTSELQSRPHLVCRLLLEKKKNNRHPLCYCFQRPRTSPRPQT